MTASPRSGLGSRGNSLVLLVGVVLLVGAPAASARTATLKVPRKAEGVVVGPDGHSRLRGTRVEVSNDLGGDGKADLVAGIPGRSTRGRGGSGAVLVAGFHGRRGHVSADFRRPFMTVVGPRPNAHIGATFHVVNDANGDGRDEVVIGVVGIRPGYRTFYVVFGQDHARVDLATLDGTPAGPRSQGYRIDVPGHSDTVGPPVAAGDINADGLGDLAIPWTRGEENSVVSVVPGQRSNTPVTVGAPGATYMDIVGITPIAPSLVVAPVGDFDHDGRSDLLIGADAEDAASACCGGALLAYGARQPNTIVPFYTPGQTGLVLGGSTTPVAVAGIGDTNGDRRPDLALNDGDSSVVFGATGRRAKLSLARLGRDGYRMNGVAFSLAGLGDINGDQLADYAAGSLIVLGSRSRRPPIPRNLGRRGVRLVDTRLRPEDRPGGATAYRLGNVDRIPGNEVLVQTTPSKMARLEYDSVVSGRAIQTAIRQTARRVR